MTATVTKPPPATLHGEPRLHPTTLGRYRGPDDEQRELRCLHLPDGRRLVVDWRRERRADARLVGELAADEPPQNAAILARVYLDDPTRGRCRALRAGDVFGVSPHRARDEVEGSREPLCDERGTLYEIRVLREDDSYPQLRWISRTGSETGRPLSLRAVVGRLQSYEPALTLTRRALAIHKSDGHVSTCCLRDELQRVEASPLVLNRGLREAVLARAAEGVTFSEIALRCGRVKHDAKGVYSGETSWLSRRIGVLPEGGKEEPTPWVHGDVLALIAREGLDLAPIEVEAA
jgi:hypothetical protein